MDILKEQIGDDLAPLRSGGITLYPASELQRIFSWAQASGRVIEWIEGAFYDPHAGQGQLSLSYMCERGSDYEAFRQSCLKLVGPMQTEGAEIGMGAYFEIGISRKQAGRLNRALCGMGITLAPVAAIGCVQTLLAPHTVAVVGGMDPKVDAWAVSDFRDSLAQGYTVIAVIIVGYWLFTGSFSRGQFLKIRSANIALVLSGFTFGFAMAVASTVLSGVRTNGTDLRL